MTTQLPPFTRDASLAHLLTDSRNVVPTSARHSVPWDCVLTGLPGTNGDLGAVVEAKAAGVADCCAGGNFCRVGHAAGAGGNAVVGTVATGFTVVAETDGFTVVAPCPTGVFPFTGPAPRGCAVTDIRL